jgi:hypothetical protein
VFSTGISPGDKKGMDLKNGLGSARDIFDRGGRDSDPGVWVSGLDPLCVFREDQGAAGGGGAAVPVGGMGGGAEG